MAKQERSIRQMDRDLLGAVVVINNKILRGQREDTAGTLAAELLRSYRVHVSGHFDSVLVGNAASSAELTGGDGGAPPTHETTPAGSSSAGTRDRLYHCAESLDDVVATLNTAIAAGARVIITVGGTGITMGDIAPEATAAFLEVRMDGIAQQVREYGLSVTPLASLSRGLVGITHRGPGGVLIVNAPGSRGGVKDSLAVVCPLLPHIFEQLDDQMD